ncbi:MAG: helix-turn-helix domain-containing protein [Phycisphaeraceae bacterium]
MVESVWSKGYDAVIEAVVAMREEAGLTQRELAERIGREQSFIGRIETRQRRVDLVEFIWIARCCGFDGKVELAKVTDQVLDLIPKKPRRIKK